MKNRDALLAVLRSTNSPAEKASYAFAHLYISAENDEHAKEIVKIFYENHPDAAKTFFAGIKLPQRWLPKDFSYAGYLP